MESLVWAAGLGRLSAMGICNGVIYFYLQTEVMEFPHEFALWGSLAAAALSVVVMIPRSFAVGLALYGLPLAGYGIIGYIRFGFPDFSRLPLWKLALLDNGQWIWVSVAAAVLFYSMTMVTLLLGIPPLNSVAEPDGSNRTADVGAGQGGASTALARLRSVRPGVSPGFARILSFRCVCWATGTIPASGVLSISNSMGVRPIETAP